MIFVSHSSKDDDFVDNLRTALHRRGLQTWVDHFDTPGGSFWDEVVDTALAASAVLVLVLSPDAVVSENVGVEWREFKRQGKVIVPIKVRECPTPLLIRHLIHIDFTDPLHFDDALDRLVDTLTRLTGLKETGQVRVVDVDGISEELEMAQLKYAMRDLQEKLDLFIGEDQLLFVFPRQRKTMVINLDREKIFLGRSIEADVDLSPYDFENSSVSRQHALLTVGNSSLTITDLNSTNGTFIERHQLTPMIPFPVKSGAMLRLGNLVVQTYFNKALDGNRGE
jgi:pSer/pThr/pTyr-binding forkhead associated (FHA) protein